MIHHLLNRSGNYMGNTTGENPFIIIARVQVKEGMVEKYLDIADEVDRAAEVNTPGLLVHNFDSDPDDPLAFTWTEVFQNSNAFLMHASNPYAAEYLGKHAPLADDLSVEIYGNVSKEIEDILDSMGHPTKHFKTTRVGYVRTEHFT